MKACIDKIVDLETARIANKNVHLPVKSYVWNFGALSGFIYRPYTYTLSIVDMKPNVLLKTNIFA